MRAFDPRHATRLFVAASLIALGVAPGAFAQRIVGPPAAGEPARNPIPTPESFFGFRLGTDFKMAHWTDMVRYYETLEKASDRMKVVNMGPTTMGHPFLALFISSPQNIARLEDYRRMNATLSDPRGHGDPELERLVLDGKAVVLQSMSLHATEIGGSQMAPEFVYDLLSRNDDEAKRILDNVISIVIPSFNPDGQVMTTEWYRRTLGTEAEGTSPPWLYHKYAGHDNNRDGFQTNLVESRYMAQLLFRDWIPQAYVDHHHMGSNGARIYLPPYAEPVRPSADPIVWREIAWFGSHMATKEEEYGMSGVINDAVYSGWGHMGFHWITPFHNIAGMLTESASARLASPLEIPADQLRGNTRNLPVYEEQTNFPNPWPGGTWRLRDILDRQKIAAWSTLDLAARNKETVLRNAYLKAKHQTERGAAGTPKAFVVPFREQHDPLTTLKMIDKLLAQGVEILQSANGFTVGGTTYGPGTFVVSMAQPKMGLVRWMLGETHYPDNTWTRDNEGNPIRPYDMSTDTMNEFMGVRADPVTVPVPEGLTKVTAARPEAGKVVSGSRGYVLDGRLNDSFRAANLLLAKGVAVRRVDTATGTLKAGDYVVPRAAASVINDVAATTGVDFAANTTNATGASHPLKPLRIAMYQRFSGGNMDEGWTRLLFEQFDAPYTSLFDPELKAGNLNAKYDVIVLPSDNPATMTGLRGGGPGRGGAMMPPTPPPPAGRQAVARGGGGGGNTNLGGGGQGRGGGRGGSVYPEEFRTGFGEEGVKALDDFVKAGGTLVTFADAGSFAIEYFNLPVRNVVAGLSSKQFWSPGSTLKITVDNANWLGYGMPSSALATFLAGSQVYEILPTGAASITTVARYVDRDVLKSGWLLGEEVIAGKPAIVEATYGQGRVVLIGFRTQHRAQTHGTYKFLFNALMAHP